MRVLYLGNFKKHFIDRKADWMCYIGFSGCWQFERFIPYLQWFQFYSVPTVVLSIKYIIYYVLSIKVRGSYWTTWNTILTYFSLNRSSIVHHRNNELGRKNMRFKGSDRQAKIHLRYESESIQHKWSNLCPQNLLASKLTLVWNSKTRRLVLHCWTHDSCVNCHVHQAWRWSNPLEDSVDLFWWKRNPILQKLCTIQNYRHYFWLVFSPIWNA